MNTYNHHLGDYAKDTKDLSPLEHGVYRLLLDFNYATEQPIPNEVDKLYRVVGAQSHAERKAVVRLVAERFFPVNGDGRRHNKRAEAEIQKYRAREHNRKGQGARRAPEKPGENPGRNPDGYPTDPERIPNGSPETLTKNQSQKEQRHPLLTQGKAATLSLPCRTARMKS
jgi:uncharacterized protein YdaU (DUF1376 family)